MICANTLWNIANFRVDLVTTLIDKGFEVVVLGPADASQEFLRGIGCELAISPPIKRGFGILGDTRFLWFYNQTLKKVRPDVVLNFTIKPNIYGGFATARHNIPVINTLTGLGVSFLGGGLVRLLAIWLYRLSQKRVKCVFFQNTDDHGEFVRRNVIRRDQCRLIQGSGVNLTKFQLTPLPPADRFVFLMIARPIAEKGIREFWEAANILRREHSRVEFHYVGGDEEELSRLVPKAEKGVIKVFGKVSDVRPYISAANSLVLPSYREGLARSLLEAMAMGRPIVSTDAPGCKQLLQDGNTGIMCKASDANSLLEGMREMLEMSEITKEAMIKRAYRLVVEGYSVDRVIDTYLEEIALTIKHGLPKF